MLTFHQPNRVKIGEHVELFSKDGSFLRAKIAGILKKSYLLTVEQTELQEKPLQLEKTIAIGMPKVL